MLFVAATSARLSLLHPCLPRLQYDRLGTQSVLDWTPECATKKVDFEFRTAVCECILIDSFFNNHTHTHTHVRTDLIFFCFYFFPVKQNANGAASAAKNLILVAGHSVTISGHLEDANKDENDWFLLDYQRHRGLPEAIVGHIQAGIAEAQRDPMSLLIFSGGETRAATGPETEGASYYRVADAMQLWPASSTVRARTVTEDFATDSFENL